MKSHPDIPSSLRNDYDLQLNNERKQMTEQRVHVKRLQITVNLGVKKVVTLQHREREKEED